MRKSFLNVSVNEPSEVCVSLSVGQALRQMNRQRQLQQASSKTSASMNKQMTLIAGLNTSWFDTVLFIKLNSGSVVNQEVVDFDLDTDCPPCGGG